MTTIEKIGAEIEKVFCISVITNELRTPMEVKAEILQIIGKYAEQEPISVSVSEKEPDEISEEVTLRFFRNSLKVRWQDMVIYNVEWLKKNWQMEMDIVCGVKPCDDAVSRQAVLDLIEHYNSDGLGSVFYGYEQGVKFANAVNKLPSVRPQEQTGKWEEIVKEHKCYARDDTYTTTEYHCSECGAEPLAESARDDSDYAFSNFCPNCGAKMESEEQTE